MDSVLIALFGLVVGSFLNAVIYRLSVGDSAIRGRSYCPSCRHELAARDLIPVLSYVALGGRCRYCRKPISIRYPLIELATGFVFVLTYLHFGSSFNMRTVLYLVYGAFLIVIFAYDLLHYLILDSVIIPAIIIAFIGNTILGVPWQSMLIAGLVAAGFFALQFIVSRGRWIGGGDIRLGFFMGVMLGWPLILVALFIAYISGGSIGLILIAQGSKTLQSKVPFGTFLTLGTYAALLYGPQLLSWYMNKLPL